MGARSRWVVIAALLAGACQGEDPDTLGTWDGPPPRLVSVGVRGQLGNHGSDLGAARDERRAPPSAVVTPDGRFVVFATTADNLVAQDTSRSDQFREIFIRDMKRNITERINVSSSEEQANVGDEPDDDGYFYFEDNMLGGISADGRYVVFASTSSNLVADDTNRSWDVFLRDRKWGTTTLVSRTPVAGPGDEDSFHPAISADGSTVAFTSVASNLNARDRNQLDDVFTFDVATQKVSRVSMADDEAEARQRTTGKTDSWYEYGGQDPAISADGSVVAFASTADNLVPGDTNDLPDVFVRAIDTGTTTRVSVSSIGDQAKPIDDPDNEVAIYSHWADDVALSGDGSVVAFSTPAPNLVEGDTNGISDLFVHDLKTGETERVSVSTSGREPRTGLSEEFTGDGSYGASMSHDGRLVAFFSGGDLVSGDPDIQGGSGHDIFIRDRRTDRTMFVTYRHDGRPSAAWNLYGPSLSSNGQWLVFASDDKKVVPETRRAESMGWVFLQELPEELSG
jgi:Tol biopolymer transport system component